MCFTLIGAKEHSGWQRCSSPSGCITVS